MRDMREDSDASFLAKVTIYVEVAVIAALAGIFLVVHYPWLVHVAVALLIFLDITVVGVYWLFVENE